MAPRTTNLCGNEPAMLTPEERDARLARMQEAIDSQKYETEETKTSDPTPKTWEAFRSVIAQTEITGVDVTPARTGVKVDQPTPAAATGDLPTFAKVSLGSLNPAGRKGRDRSSDAPGAKVVMQCDLKTGKQVFIDLPAKPMKAVAPPTLPPPIPAADNSAAVGSPAAAAPPTTAPSASGSTPAPASQPPLATSPAVPPKATCESGVGASEDDVEQLSARLAALKPSVVPDVVFPGTTLGGGVGQGPLQRPTMLVQRTTGQMVLGLLPSWTFGHDAATRVRASEVKAGFLSTSYDEEPEAAYGPKNGWYDLLVSKFGGSYSKYHRAANRWHKRLALLRVMREELLFESAEVRRVRTPTNEVWVGITARKIVQRAIGDGQIERRHCQWYRAALVEVFFMEDDDDTFAAALRGSLAKAY